MLLLFLCCAPLTRTVTGRSSHKNCLGQRQTLSLKSMFALISQALAKLLPILLGPGIVVHWPSAIVLAYDVVGQVEPEIEEHLVLKNCDERAHRSFSWRIDKTSQSRNAALRRRNFASATWKLARFARDFSEVGPKHRLRDAYALSTPDGDGQNGKGIWVGMGGAGGWTMLRHARLCEPWRAILRQIQLPECARLCRSVTQRTKQW